MRLWIHAIYIYTYLMFYQKIHIFWSLNIEKHHSYNVISACCKQGEPEVDPQQDRGIRKQTSLLWPQQFDFNHQLGMDHLNAFFLVNLSL